MDCHVRTHCKENPIYLFPGMKLRGLVLNFHIHISVNDLYFPRIGPSMLLQKNRQTNPGNISIAHRYMNAGLGTRPRPRSFIPGIFVSNFRCSVFAVHVNKTKFAVTHARLHPLLSRPLPHLSSAKTHTEPDCNKLGVFFGKKSRSL